MNREKGSGVIDTGYRSFVKSIKDKYPKGSNVSLLVRKDNKTLETKQIKGIVEGTYRDFMVIRTRRGYRTAFNFVTMYVDNNRINRG